MTPAEQAGIMRQATQGHVTLEDIATMATRAKVTPVGAVSPNPESHYG